MNFLRAISESSEQQFEHLIGLGQVAEVCLQKEDWRARSWVRDSVNKNFEKLQILNFNPTEGSRGLQKVRYSSNL